MAKKRDEKKTKRASKDTSRMSEHKARGKTKSGAEAHPTPPKAAKAPEHRTAEEVKEEKICEPRPPALEELADTLRLDLPQKLLSTLAEHGIRTLLDVRKAGGLGHVEGLPAALDDPAIHTIEAHANLSILSPDVALNAKLIEKGYNSITAIADAPRHEFVAATHEQMGDVKAAQLYEMAAAQSKFLNNVLTGIRADMANNYLSARAGDRAALSEALPTRCACKDCEAAVSPLAYLVDLLDYALKHIKLTGGTMSSIARASLMKRLLPGQPQEKPGNGNGNGKGEPKPKPPAKPIITPHGGTYNGAVSIRLSTSQSEVEIYYTIDNSDPSRSSTKYIGPIMLATNTTQITKTLKARAYLMYYDEDGNEYWLGSLIAQATFTITPLQEAATPTITPNGGTLIASASAPASVWLSTTTPGAEIRYMLDGSEPTSSSPQYTGTIKLETTGTVTVKARAFKSGMIESSTASASFAIVSTPENLPGRGLMGEYYDNTDFTDLKVVRMDARINFDWGNGSPDSSIDPDTFWVRWTGRIEPRYSETYKFYTVSDDGIRVKIDGILVIDSWADQPPTEKAGETIALIAGKKYSITVEYYERGGGAVAMLIWESPSQPKEVVPQRQLFPSIDLQFLADTFHQPFDRLPASCKMADAQVRQARICIEVLRSYLGTRPLADAAKERALAKAEKDYLLAAYTALLTKIGTSFDEIRLARSGDEAARKALAERLGIDVGYLDALFLNPLAMPEVLTEQKLEELFGLRDTTRDPVTDTPSPSSLETWRVEYLRTLWKEQDHPTDPYSEDFSPAEDCLPIIDPDIIGPDDFRYPDLSRTTFGIIWKARRDWVDSQIQTLAGKKKTRIIDSQSLIVPDMEQMLELMYKPVTYRMYTVTPWASATPVTDFDQLHQKLTGGTADEVKNAKERIKQDLCLTPDAFGRLMAIRSKDQMWWSDYRNEEVKDDEWRELYSILVQAQKARLFPGWITEEKMARIHFDPNEFWFSLREPKEGDWPPITPQPYIDPDLVKIQDLPEPTVGGRALELWEERKKSLVQINNDLKKEREKNGFDAMIRLAVGYEYPGNGLKYTPDFVKQKLDSADPADVEFATKIIHEEMCMTVDEFNRLYLIRAKDAETNPLKKPTAAEYAEVYALLTQARKKKHEYRGWTPPPPIPFYSGWINEENDSSTGVVYWTALKAKLPRWRASTEARQAWVQALRIRSSAPIIDPDVVSPGDIKNPVSGNPAFDRWQERQEKVSGLIDALKNTSPSATPLQRLNDLFAFDYNGVETGFTPDTLQDLAKDRKKGTDITGRLNQLSLDNPSFAYLIRIINLAKENQPILEAEWEGVYSILVQVYKKRKYAEWRDEERGAVDPVLLITLSPDFFKFPEVDKTIFPLPPPPWEPTPWRSNWEARRDWQDTLQSRIDQKSAVIEALMAAVSAAEETTLPMLRDALVMAIDKGGNTRDTKAKWVTDYLLIDANAGGCQMTTRVSQAIETIQGVLWSIRTGQLEDTYPDLDLVAPNFDEEWQWLGSYATWRAAMFVFMYPENILIPSLRKHQTPAFRRLVSDLHSISRLTPEHARAVVKTYAEYFEDICTLKLEASCQAKTQTSNGERDILYMFAHASATNTVYWSAYDPQNASAYAQTFWDPVPGLSNVLSIVGVVPYEQDSGMREKQRFVYVFVRTIEKGAQKLVFMKYDLENQGWVGDATELKLPKEQGKGETTAFWAFLKQRWGSAEPPHIAIQLPTGTIYAGALNKDATNWANEEWQPLVTIHNFYGTLLAMIATDTGQTDEFYLVGQSHPPSVQGLVYRLFGPRDEQQTGSQWKLAGSASDYPFRGAFCWPNTDELLVFYAPSGGSPFTNSLLIKPGHAPSVGQRRVDRYVDSGGIMDLPRGMERVPPRSGSHGDNRLMVAYQGESQCFRTLLVRSGDKVTAVSPVTPSPLIFDAADPPALIPQISGQALQERRIKLITLFNRNQATSRSNIAYLEEAFYFIPLQIALALQQRGQYVAALDWFRTVYDYSQPIKDRKIYYGLTKEKSLPEDSNRAGDWLLDPLNPHLIAETRRNTYTRYTLFSLIRCFLEYADAEFTRDTSESVPRARALYMTALELLEAPELKRGAKECEDPIRILDAWVRSALQNAAAQWLPSWTEVKKELESIPYANVLSHAAESAKDMLSETSSLWGERFKNALEMVRTIMEEEVGPPPTLAELLEQTGITAGRAHSALLAKPAFAEALAAVGASAAKTARLEILRVSGIDITTIERDMPPMPWLRKPAAFFLGNTSGSQTATSPNPASTEALFPLAEPIPVAAGYTPTASFWFCVPANPVLNALKLRAELNLFKLRTCRNIAGMQRQLEPYAAPTDTVSGLPMIGAGGQLVLPGTTVLRPTPYRYKVLIERAKQLVSIAQQMEASMLSALEKRDAEAYQLLKARQDVRMASAGIRLQNLRVTEARDGTKLATLQRNRAQFQADNYEKWIQEDLNQYERDLIGWYTALGIAQAVSVAAQGGLTAMTQSKDVPPWLAVAFNVANAIKTAADQAAILAQTNINILGIHASYERRKQEWEFQKELAMKDVEIGNQQITIAENHERVVGQELVIAEMQRDHAEAIVEFLSNKFTNVELYDWMIDILERVYSFFLQQATSVAKLAENQLAFERHETPPAYIQADYWEAPTEEMGGQTDGRAPDRRGLTGSARLLQDIYQLDQYAFETDKRKLQLTKTISLTRLSPAEFQRFLETGVMTFRTPMEMFDRDFPGHYLRLIKRVRTSVVALIPPTQGIKATLTTTGLSRVVIGGDIFQTAIVRRDPESVALTSPLNATGLFELEPQSEMLYPFEAIGVDTSWEFRMPKAANLFDYSTIADVLITIEYTALNSFDYRQQVIPSLPPTLSADRPFTFRHEFADQWYDLHNPDQTKTPMAVKFKTRREDFPPNIDNLKIQQVLLYFVRANGKTFEVPVSGFTFTEQSGGGKVGGGAASIDGVISTRRGNAGSWTAMLGKAPFGEWELALPDMPEIRNYFKNDEIEDILFVITYSGRTPEWPD